MTPLAEARGPPVSMVHCSSSIAAARPIRRGTPTTIPSVPIIHTAGPGRRKPCPEYRSRYEAHSLRWRQAVRRHSPTSGQEMASRFRARPARASPSRPSPRVTKVSIPSLSRIAQARRFPTRLPFRYTLRPFRLLRRAVYYRVAVFLWGIAASADQLVAVGTGGVISRRLMAGVDSAQFRDHRVARGSDVRL